MVQDVVKNERIAIIGSGGIGGYLAAQLQAAGHDVVLCVRTPFEKLVIVEQDGKEITVPVRIATDPSAEQPAKWILVTTKAQDVPGAAEWLKHLNGPESVSVVIQNGIDHEERVRPFLPADATVLPSIIICAVERTEPGRIVHHFGAKITVPAGPDSDAFARLFAGTVFEIEASSTFLTVAWSKLLSNAMANPLTALTLRRNAVFDDERMRELARAVGREVLAVSKAVGATIPDTAIETILAGFSKMRSGGSSMMYDRLAERPMEFQFITGAVVAAADRHGIEVPVNRTILALLSGASGHRLDGSA